MPSSGRLDLHPVPEILRDLERAPRRPGPDLDPRLRAFPNYRRSLRQGVRSSLLHARQLVADLPDPVEISRRSFGLDPRLRAFFSSPARMQEAISRAPTLVAFLENFYFCL